MFLPFRSILLPVLLILPGCELVPRLNFLFPVKILYDKSFGNALYYDKTIIEDYWFTQIQEVDLLLQTLPGIDVSFDISLIRELNKREESILQQYDIENSTYSKQFLKEFADEQKVTQTSATITIVTWKITPGYFWDKNELEPLDCEHNGQHFVFLDLANLRPVTGILMRTLTILGIESKINVDENQITWKDSTMPGLETMISMKHCPGEGYTTNSTVSKLRFSWNEKICRVELGHPEWLLTHNASQHEEETGCRNLFCHKLGTNKTGYLQSRGFYNYPCRESHVCHRGKCVRAGVRLVNREILNCVTSTHSGINGRYEVLVAACKRSTYQPQTFTMENMSGQGFHIIIRSQNWVNDKICLSSNGSSVFAELCDNEETFGLQWIFLYNETVNGYFLFHIETKTFARVAHNKLSGDQRVDLKDGSYRWNIVQCEGNSNLNIIECPDFWKLRMHHNNKGMFQPLENFILDPGSSHFSTSFRPSVLNSESTMNGSTEIAVNIKWVALICVGIGAGLIVLVMAIHCYVMKRRTEKKNHVDSPRTGPLQSSTRSYSSIDNNLEFQMKHLKIDQKIGSGAFGDVYRGYAYGIASEGVTTTVAVKIPVDNINSSIHSEAKILAEISNHPNIIKLLGVCAEPEQTMLILEYCAKGNLRDYLVKNSTSLETKHQLVLQLHTKTSKSMKEKDELSESSPLALNSEPITIHQIAKWAYEISAGMKYISSLRILHGDLACRNILLSETKTVKITDFGLSKQLSRDNNYNYWTHTKGNYFGGSFGVVLWELFSLGSMPYSEIDSIESLMERISSGYRLERPKIALSSVYNIMQRCWSRRPTDRPNFSQIEEEMQTIFKEMIDEE